MDRTKRSEVDPTRRIKQLRQWRGRPDPCTPVGVMIGPLLKRLSRDSKRFDRCVALWEELVPPELASHASLVGLRAGTLTVHVDSSAILFDLDRHLRGGVEQQMRATGILNRVRLKLGEPSCSEVRGEMPPHVYALLEDDDLPGVPLMDLPVERDDEYLV